MEMIHDTIVVWSDTGKALEKSLDHFNDIQPQMQFNITFLDLLVTKKPSSWLAYPVCPLIVY